MKTPPNSDALIAEFMSRNNADELGTQGIIKYLRAANWNLHTAEDNYWNTTEESSDVYNKKRYMALWKKYADPSNPEFITIDGTLAYCEDLGIAPEDVVMLAIAYITQAPDMGKFSKTEFINGWRPYLADTIAKQKKALEGIRASLEDDAFFRDVYNYTFVYAKTEGQRSLACDIACELWKLLIPIDPANSLSEEALGWWVTFLDESGGKAVSKDTWNLFIEFSRTIDPEFANYDEMAAWPSVIDGFVEYAREKLAAK